MKLNLFPSVRLIRLLALTAPLWFLHALWPLGWIPAVTLLLGLLAAAVKQALALPHAADFEVERHLPPRFAFGNEHSIGLTLSNSSDTDVSLELCDHFPASLTPLSEPEQADLPGGAALRIDSRVRPHRRGADQFGPLHCRLSLPGGLVVRQFELGAATPIKVYPRFTGVDRFDLLAKIDERDDMIRIPRLLRGQGGEFESLRPYRRGDDPRYLDWKASAKRGSLITRNYQVERGQHLSVLIDSGRFMNEKIGNASRLEHAMNAAVMLAHVVQTRGDTMSLAAFSNKIQTWLPPIKGSALIPSVLESLYKVQASNVESDYWSGVAGVLSRLKKRGLIIMMTDILDESGSSGLISNLARAAGQHQVLCVVFVEEALYHTASAAPQGVDGVWRRAAASHLTVRRRLALEQMRARGVAVLETTPERLSMQLVRSYLELRQAG